MRNFFFVLTIAVLGIAIFLIVNYMDKDSQVKVKISMEGSVFKDVAFIQKKDGQIKLKLASAEAFMSDDGKLLELNYPVMFFPDKEVTVKAHKGYYYPETGELFLREAIEGLSKDYKILGTEFYWNSKDKTLYSEKPLRIEGKRFTIEGNSGRATADLIELKKGVRAIVYSKK